MGALSCVWRGLPRWAWRLRTSAAAARYACRLAARRVPSTLPARTVCPPRCGNTRRAPRSPSLNSIICHTVCTALQAPRMALALTAINSTGCTSSKAHHLHYLLRPHSLTTYPAHPHAHTLHFPPPSSACLTTFCTPAWRMALLCASSLPYLQAWPLFMTFLSQAACKGFVTPTCLTLPALPTPPTSGHRRAFAYHSRLAARL